MRRTIVLLATMALTLLVASGVALAVTKIGTNGPDTLRGTNGADNLLSLGGNDRIFGLAGDDSLLGGLGKDIVFGGNERRPFGGEKNLVGGRGNDVVAAGKGSDNVVGEEGNDWIADGEDPGRSEDFLSGGAGNDVVEVAQKPAFKDIVTCGGGFDWVFADKKDTIAPDCERVADRPSEFDALFETIPESFWEELPPLPNREDLPPAPPNREGLPPPQG